MALDAMSLGGGGDRPSSSHEHRQSLEVVDLQERACAADVALEGGPTREVARPKLIGAVGVGEEVVLLQGPCDAFLVLGPDVRVGGRVERAHAPVRVDVPEQTEC